MDDFLLSKFGVTVAQFQEFVTAAAYMTIAEQDAGLHPSQAIVRDGKSYYPGHPLFQAWTSLDTHFLVKKHSRIANLMDRRTW